MILALKTDSPTAEIYALKESGEVVSREIWQADRTLARDLLAKIETLLNQDFDQLSGVIAFKGPGSFTGLRIGITTANAISYAKHIPIVATDGEKWLSDGLERLKNGQTDQIALPEYGAPANITMPKK